MTNVFVAGHRGMVGSAIVRRLTSQEGVQVMTRERCELDLLQQERVNDFFRQNRIDQVYLAAAKVGGIHANNSYPAEFIYQNIQVQSNVIHAAHINDVQKLLFLGSSCIYPKHAEQPMREEALLTGYLEATNEPYAVAKIAGIKLCESYNRQYGRDYRSVMPTNLYGPNDNYHLENSHVVPALIRRFHEVMNDEEEEIVIWGTGTPKREFMHVDDMASACVHIMNLMQPTYQSHTSSMCSHVNVGTGKDCTIRELAETIAEISGYKGQLFFDASKPDGAPRKLLDVSKLKRFGWESTIELKDGLRDAYQWYVENAVYV